MKKLVLLSVCLVIGFMACDDGEVPAADQSSIFIEDVARFEGNSGTSIFTFRVKMDKATTQDVSFNYETRDGTAEAGSDYEATSGTKTIAVGATEAFIEVTINGDEEYEEEEKFEVFISTPINVKISGDVAEGTIRNEDSFEPVDNEGYSTPASYAGMTLTWSDEFDAANLNTNDWTYETGNNGWGNNELQNYKSGTSNAYLSNGKLVIEARQEGSAYTSARIITRDKQSFKYGRIDIRAKLPKGQGLWPALWMLGQSYGTEGWPACGEIDIMEMVGKSPSTTHGTLHWSNTNGSHAEYGGSTTLGSGLLADEYHVYTIVWNSSSIKWYLDDNHFHTTNITESHMTEFHKPHFFIFNVAVGGNWPGDPDGTATFPQRMVVDYVRVFQ